MEKILVYQRQMEKRLTEGKVTNYYYASIKQETVLRLLLFNFIKDFDLRVSSQGAVNKSKVHQSFK